METTITLQEAKDLYARTTDTAIKSFLDNKFGKELLRENKPEPGTEKQKPPVTWEEAAVMMEDNWYIDEFSVLCNPPDMPPPDLIVYNHNKNLVPSEKSARSVLAYCQLLTITAAVNKCLEAEDGKHYEIYFGKGIGEYSLVVTIPLICTSYAAAEHIVKHFTPLLKEFFMVD